MFKKTLPFLFLLLTSAAFAQQPTITSKPPESGWSYYLAEEVKLYKIPGSTVIAAKKFDNRPKAFRPITVEVDSENPPMVRAWPKTGFVPANLVPSENEPNIYLLVGDPGTYIIEVVVFDVGKGFRWNTAEVVLESPSGTPPVDDEPDQPPPVSDDAALIAKLKALSKAEAIKVNDKPTAKALGTWWIGLENQVAAAPDMRKAEGIIADKCEEILGLRPRPVTSNWNPYLLVISKEVSSIKDLTPKRYARFFKAIGQGLVEASE